MENKIEEVFKDSVKSDHSPVPQPIRREKDSLDDFEHLGLDSSPLQEALKEGAAIGVSSAAAARDVLGEIDSLFDSAAASTTAAVTKITTDDDLFDPFKKDLKMDSNLLEMGDTHFTPLNVKQDDEKLDKFLSELTSFAPPVPSHDVSPFDNESKVLLDGYKTATQNFMELERGDVIPPAKMSTGNDYNVDRYERTYNDPVITEALPEISAKDDFDPFKNDFHDVEEDVITPLKSNIVETQPEIIKFEEPVVFIPEPSPPTPPEHAPAPPTPVIVQELLEEYIEPVKAAIIKPKPAITDAEAIFKKMGLDAWFTPERLNPKVESLIYWRDPKKSGPVFGGVLVVLLALTYLSLISVVAYVSLLALTATISFRIYKNIVQAVQKTGDGHPFKEFLETDLSLPHDKVKEIVEVAIAHLNGAVVELRRLFLVEDLVDSIKFGVLLWCFTYLGAWFNGMTLVIIAWVALFSLPKLYETNKTQIDANLDLVRSKLAEITSKVKAAIPIGKKVEEKKEQ